MLSLNNLQPNSNQPMEHSDLAPSVSYSHYEVYASADNNTTTEYFVEGRTGSYRH